MILIFQLIAGAAVTFTTLCAHAVLVAILTTALVFGRVIVLTSLVSLVWHRFIQ